MSAAQELLPCPFCGSTSVEQHDSSRPGSVSRWHQIVCSNCEAKGPETQGCSLSYHGADGIAEAALECVEAWNTRTSRLPVGGDVERLKDALEDCRTHRDAWRDAIILARDEASEGSEDPEADRMYWNHELRAFDRTFSALSPSGAANHE